MNIENILPKSRKGDEHAYVVMGLNAPEPGAVIWMVAAGETDPVFRGLGFNKELEEDFIKEARKLSFAQTELTFYPERTDSIAITASLEAKDFPLTVIGTLLNTRPGRCEIIGVGPKVIEESLGDLVWVDNIVEADGEEVPIANESSSLESEDTSN